MTTKELKQIIREEVQKSLAVPHRKQKRTKRTKPVSLKELKRTIRKLVVEELEAMKAKEEPKTVKELAEKIVGQMSEDDKRDYSAKRDEWRDGISMWPSMEGVDMDKLFNHIDQLVAIDQT